VIVELLNSPLVPMEALSILIKSRVKRIMQLVLKTLIDIIPLKDRKVLREALPTLRGFISNNYPQLMKSVKMTETADEQVVFGQPEMILRDMWSNIGKTEGYTGQTFVLKDVKYIIEALNEIKVENLINAKNYMDKKVKLQSNDPFSGSAEIIKLRKELHELLLKNKGNVPDQSNIEDYNKYNLLVQKIQRKEDEKPTIYGSVDEIYKQMIKETITKK
jgi:hypothetical protein